MILFLVIFGSAYLPAQGQSSDLQFPTPITSNEVSGRIAPRPLGDARETLYYWVFDGSQGDVFINAVFDNLNGEIQVFVADGMRPVARILTFADFGETETGRVFYLRKPERLILRVRGRTPNDDPAIFRIKFAGSFLAIADPERFAAPELPTVQRPAPREEAAEAREEVAETREERPESIPTVEETAPETPSEEERTAKTQLEPQPREQRPRREPRSRVRVVVEDHVAKLPIPADERKEEPPAETRDTEKEATPETRTGEKEEADADPAEAREPEDKAPAEEEKPAGKPVRERALVVMFTDGSSMNLPMSDVRSFSVDGTVLRITTRNGRTRRFPMSDVTSLVVD